MVQAAGRQFLVEPIGKQQHEDLSKRAVINFVPMKGNLEPISSDVVSDLSEDQRYLYEMCQAVASGYVCSLLQNRSLGALHNARWLTRTNRVLHLYVSTVNPASTLVDLVHIIMNVCAPSWFY